MVKHFDARLVKQLADIEEVDIETRKSADSPPHRVTIWVVVVNGEVYVRSVRGPSGRWYREITTHPLATLYVEDQSIPVRGASVAADQAVISSVSEEFLRKYQKYPEYVRPMVVDRVLPTTIRLEPA